jgi:hypothetical protein
MVFFTVGILATAWFLIRVVPKPSRVNYPCVQATAPLMSGFVLYLIGLFGSVAAFNRFRYFRLRSRNLMALFFLLGAALFFLWSVIQLPVSSQAKKTMTGTSFFPPNEPIGEAEGIFKGRVVWMWDPSATNENCSNSSNGNGIIDAGDDGWFMSQNNNQTAIDSMVIKSLIGLTGKSDMHEAWDTLFKFYNIKHGHGNVGYSANQKIFIKINATSAYGGLAEGRFNADLGRTDILTINDFVSETNPFVVLSILRQLVNHALVPENMIYVGDPARNVYKEFYNLWHAEFPGIHVLGNNLLHPELNITPLGRTPVAVTTSDKVFFSDHGTVMPLAISDKLFTIFEEMDYLINIPALKAHGTGGITLAAKNHFGSFTREWAMHLHKGLMDSVDYPLRQGYGLYRVQTDIMMHNLLSGKNLLIIVDGLYPGEDALGVPFRWTSPPFSNDWCSSLMMSLDPVAIESVCHDFLRTEYNGPTYAESRPNWPGVDDYLHQAADSALWPAAITYDPDANGILIASLGVHEHWNDSLRKQYSRNLGSGPGIELYKAHEIHTGIPDELFGFNIRVYPNPASDFIHIANFENESTRYQLINLEGKPLLSGTISPQHDSSVNLTGLKNGIYILRLQNKGKNTSVKIIRNASQ